MTLGFSRETGNLTFEVTAETPSPGKSMVCSDVGCYYMYFIVCMCACTRVCVCVYARACVCVYVNLLQGDCCCSIDFDGQWWQVQALTVCTAALTEVAPT